MNEKQLLTVLALCISTVIACAAKQPPSIDRSASEPVKYIGSDQPDKRFYHGLLRQAVGVHRYQALRANRTNPPERGFVGWTYNHGPNLAYWNGRFFLHYLSNPKEEHNPPGRTLLMTSKDGRQWSDPTVVFPEYPLPEISRGSVCLPAGTFSVMHQRMGFYVAPDGRLLTLGFYSYCPTPRDGPNKGQGLGRVVREIYEDGSFGPIYFIRYNRHAGFNETNTRYPFYMESPDSGFVKACEALLSDKLVTLQWWEEDRAEDGFYTLDPGDQEPKALSYCRRPDGVVVGLWKNRLSALSGDGGKTWTPLVRSETLMFGGAKVWIQRTEDSRYAIVYNHSATCRNRFPLAVMTSDDCYSFDDLLCVHGEVPPMRYQGLHKNLGPQYVRGIMPGNGDPPGQHIWNTYSVNKEDIWVSRTRVPVTGRVDDHVDQDFDSLSNESDLELWNLYVPAWAPVAVASDPAGESNKCLELRDQEPYDYALVERIFPKGRNVTVSFRVFVRRTGHGVLEFEVQDGRGRRPVRLRFDGEWLSMDRAATEPRPLPLGTGRWHDLKLSLDCERQKYDLELDGRTARRGIDFGEKVETLERFVFRTGPWRGDVRAFLLDGEPGQPGLCNEDLAGTDHMVPASVYLIDDVRTRAE